MLIRVAQKEYESSKNRPFLYATVTAERHGSASVFSYKLRARFTVAERGGAPSCAST